MLALAFAVILFRPDPDLAPWASTSGAGPASSAATKSREETAHPRLARFAKPSRLKHRFGRWTLVVKVDPFAQVTTCALTASRMAYDHSVLTLRLGRHANTFDAVYRIDDGPPIKASSNDLAIAHRGLKVFQDDLANPSGGLVRIPDNQLAGARQVRVELKRSGRVVTRQLTGLDGALAAARSRHCSGI